jgi:hypothetical protein
MEKWCILRTEDNYEEINEWFNTHHKLNLKDVGGYAHSYDVDSGKSNWCLLVGYSSNNHHKDAKVITIEQFRELTKASVNNTACEPQIFN